MSLPYVYAVTRRPAGKNTRYQVASARHPEHKESLFDPPSRMG